MLLISNSLQPGMFSYHPWEAFSGCTLYCTLVRALMA